MLGMPTLKRCYCFCLPIRGKFSPCVLGSQGRQEIGETHWRWRPHCQPNPAGLFQKPRQEAQALHRKTGPNLPCLVPFCPHWLWSKDEFLPRGRVCLSLWNNALDLPCSGCIRSLTDFNLGHHQYLHLSPDSIGSDMFSDITVTLRWDWRGQWMRRLL